MHFVFNHLRHVAQFDFTTVNISIGYRFRAIEVSMKYEFVKKKLKKKTSHFFSLVLTFHFVEFSERCLHFTCEWFAFKLFISLFLNETVYCLVSTMIDTFFHFIRDFHRIFPMWDIIPVEAVKQKEDQIKRLRAIGRKTDLNWRTGRWTNFKIEKIINWFHFAAKCHDTSCGCVSDVFVDVVALILADFVCVVVVVDVGEPPAPEPVPPASLSL